STACPAAVFVFFFQAEDGIRDGHVTGVQTCALPISTTDRVGEGAMLGAIALIFARQGNTVALGATIAAIAGSFLVSYTRAKAEALGLRGDVGFGSRAERVVAITAGLVLAPWGLLQWGIYLLTVTAWLAVLEGI